MANIIQDIIPSGVISAYICAPFDEAKEALEKAGYRLITGSENADLRIKHGKEAFVSKNGNYVKEGVLYIPDKGRFITRSSLVISSPKEATQAHRVGKEFYVTSVQVESVLDDSVNIPYNASAIPTNRFGDDAITCFVFGNTAKAYGEFLNNAGITEMPLYFSGQNYVNSQPNSYANQLWLGRLGGDSRLLGDFRTLRCDSAVRGVQFASTEGASHAKKIEDAYTPAKYFTAFSEVLAQSGIKLDKSLEGLVLARLEGK